MEEVLIRPHLLFRKIVLLVARRRATEDNPGGGSRVKILLVTYRRGDHGAAREGAAGTPTRELSPEIFRWQEKMEQPE